MTTSEIKAFLIDEAEYREETVNHMSKSDLLDAYLKYEGIVGFTGEIIDTIEHLWNIHLYD